MEKLAVGWQMSTRWSDPPILLMLMLPAIVAELYGIYYFLRYGPILCIPLLAAAQVCFYKFVYMQTEPADTEKYIEFKDEAAKARWAKNKIPVCTLYELFIADKVAFKVRARPCVSRVTSI